MIVSIWVFFLMGDPLAHEHGIPYVQHTAPEPVHATAWRREDFEQECRAEFEGKYPGHVVCDSGWCKQKVEVMGG